MCDVNCFEHNYFPMFIGFNVIDLFTIASHTSFSTDFLNSVSFVSLACQTGLQKKTACICVNLLPNQFKLIQSDMKAQSMKEKHKTP